MPATLIREAGDHYLLLLEQGGLESVSACLIEAGLELGVAPVGNEALERLEAAARPHLALALSADIPPKGGGSLSGR